MSNHLAHKKMLPQGFDTIFRQASTLNLVINDSKSFAYDDILSSCAKTILVSEKKKQRPPDPKLKLVRSIRQEKKDIFRHLDCQKMDSPGFFYELYSPINCPSTSQYHKVCCIKNALGYIKSCLMLALTMQFTHHYMHIVSWMLLNQVHQVNYIVL